jgi:hypothetical protein
VRGTFGKQTLIDSDENGNLRFSAAKSRNNRLGYPCEYFETRETYDSQNNRVVKLYLRAEMMDWVNNSAYRAYYDGMDDPLFEWARSPAIEGRAYTQNPGAEIRHNCDGSIVTVPIPASVYVPYLVSLEDGIEEINRRLGSLGPIEPKWIDIAKQMGSGEILVIAGYWGYRGYAPGPEIWKWDHREVYFYIHGPGWVGWRAQEHIDGNPRNDFITHKMGNLDTLVWEKSGEVVRNLDLCERPKMTTGQENFQQIIPPRFSFSYSEP